MKKLLIDVNSVVPYYVSGRVSGIGRTTMELVQALSKIQNIPFDISLYSQNMKGIGGRNMNLQFDNKHLYLPHRERLDKYLAKFPVKELLTGYDIMHIPHNFEYVHRPEKCIVTIHDAMFFSYPEKFLNHNHSRILIPPFVRKVKTIITISEQSKKDIIQYMDIPEDKITVIPWGCNRQIFYPRIVADNRFCGEKPYFIAVSCDRGRKNTISVVKAFVKFAKNNPEHHLILVWRTPSDEVLKLREDSKLETKIHFASNVSDSELGNLYAGATASFFPSLYEGFGLPIVESMACGVPCVTCRNSSLEEVGGEAAIYVEPLDADEMAGIMENFENSDYDVERLREYSIAQASKFTWENCASQTVEVYKKCLDI